MFIFLFILSIALTVFSLGHFVADLTRYIGQSIIVASPRHDNTQTTVNGISFWPVWIMLMNIPYIACFLIMR